MYFGSPNICMFNVKFIYILFQSYMHRLKVMLYNTFKSNLEQKTIFCGVECSTSGWGTKRFGLGNILNLDFQKDTITRSCCQVYKWLVPIILQCLLLLTLIFCYPFRLSSPQHVVFSGIDAGIHCALAEMGAHIRTMYTLPQYQHSYKTTLSCQSFSISHV